MNSTNPFLKTTIMFGGWIILLNILINILVGWVATTETAHKIQASPWMLSFYLAAALILTYACLVGWQEPRPAVGLIGLLTPEQKAFALANTEDVPIGKVWRCFHCDEVFYDHEKAEEHFGLGDFEFDAPACKLNVLEGGILGLYREVLAELKTYQIEDNNSCREFYRLGADHYVRERRAEEAGYAKGMADYRVDLGKEIAPLIEVLQYISGHSEAPVKVCEKIDEVCRKLTKIVNKD